MWVRSTSLKGGNTKSCGCIKNSYGESIIEQTLENANIKYSREKTFKDCFFSDDHVKCRFDFYVDDRYLIEFDGKQHYEASSGGWFTEDIVDKIKERDKYKNMWCRKNNIPLIRVPFHVVDDIKLEDLMPETTRYLI